MDTHIDKIEMREFQAHIQQYLLTPAPIAITLYDETIGYYIPTKQRLKKAELSSLNRAALQLDKFLASHGITEDELLADFSTLHKDNGG